MTEYEKAVALWQHKNITTDAELAKAFIKELHLLLTQNTYDTRRWQLGERPGKYKQHDYGTGKEEIGAAPEDVPEEMEELLSELTAVESRNALTAAAYFHAKFENMGKTACTRRKTPPLVYSSIPYHLTRNPTSSDMVFPNLFCLFTAFCPFHFSPYPA